MNSTEKLSLILQHAEEYYEHSRQYLFIQDGFMTYEIFDLGYTKCIYFADMFIKKSARGGKALGTLVKACEQLGKDYGAKVAICCVQKDNPYIKNIQSMYDLIGFKYSREDDTAMYYRLDR